MMKTQYAVRLSELLVKALINSHDDAVYLLCKNAGINCDKLLELGKEGKVLIALSHEGRKP